MLAFNQIMFLSVALGLGVAQDTSSITDTTSTAPSSTSSVPPAITEGLSDCTIRCAKLAEHFSNCSMTDPSCPCTDEKGFWHAAGECSFAQCTLEEFKAGQARINDWCLANNPNFTPTTPTVFGSPTKSVSPGASQQAVANAATGRNVIDGSQGLIAASIVVFGATFGVALVL